MSSLRAALLMLFTLIAVGCGQSIAPTVDSTIDSTVERYERTERLMGTRVTLKASGSEARAAIDESFVRLDELVMDVRSDVERLNEAAGSDEFVALSSDVFSMLTTARRYSELTDGAFDVTIGAAVDLWREARKLEALPSEDRLDDARTHVGWRHLQLRDEDQSARLDEAGVRLNLGGLGKGYGVDLVRSIFEAHGIDDGLIDFGTSSLYAIGTKTIGLKNPRGASDDASDVVDTLELSDAALSTSGDYEQFFELDGRRYHHIIDPKECQPTDNGVASVTVLLDGSIADCGTLADVLSTTVVVLGAERGEEFLSRLPFRAEAIIVKIDPDDG